ncbi:MAG: hypothetical protein RhofKO_13530 [Rhodothermales bacterium]
MSQTFKCKTADGLTAVLLVEPEQIQVVKTGWFSRKEILRRINPEAITELDWRMGQQGSKEPNFFISYTEGSAERVCGLEVKAPGVVYAAVEEVRPHKDLGRQHGDITPADLPTHETRPIHPAPQNFGRQKPPVSHRRAK